MNIKLTKKHLIWISSLLCFSVPINSGVVQGLEQTDSNYTSQTNIIDGTFQTQRRKPICQKPDRSNTTDTSLSQPEPNNNLKREITSEGIVRTYYPDGRIKELDKFGGSKIIYPDGTTTTTQPIQIQVLIPPLPPDNNEREWLVGHAGNLLSVLEILAEDESVSNYKEFENQEIPDANIYKVISMRLLYIDFLSSQ